jgi:hypothetical protein
MREFIETVSHTTDFSIARNSLMPYVHLWQQPRHSRIPSSFVYYIIFKLLGTRIMTFFLKRPFVPSIEFVERMKKFLTGEPFISGRRGLPQIELLQPQHVRAASHLSSTCSPRTGTAPLKSMRIYVSICRRVLKVEVWFNVAGLIADITEPNHAAAMGSCEDSVLFVKSGSDVLHTFFMR